MGSRGTEDPGRRDPAATSLSEIWSRIPWGKIAFWALVLAVVYMVRELFFIFFMTFLLCDTIRGLIIRIRQLLPPNLGGAWLDRGLVLGFCAIAGGVLFILASVLGPKIISEARDLVGGASRLDAEREWHRVLDQTVGPLLFRKEYGDQKDLRYQAAFTEFEKEGAHARGAYLEFPSLEASVEGAFQFTFEDGITQMARRQLAREGSGDAALPFQTWYVEKKAVDTLALKPTAASPTDPKAPVDPDAARQVLEKLEQNAGEMAALKREWKDYQLSRLVDKLKSRTDREAKHRKYYAGRRTRNPEGLPYEYETYVKLRKAYPGGLAAFAKALGEPAVSGDEKARDFEHQGFRAARTNELVERWWSSGSPAVFVREHVMAHLPELGGKLAASFKDAFRVLMRIPMELATALLLSFIILLDYPKISEKLARLKHSNLAPAYNEVAPALKRLSTLLGKFFSAQGVIALVNALLTFLAMTFFGVEHALILGSVVFVCSFIPVLGVLLSGVPIVLVSIVQPAGSIWLALKMIVAIVLVHFIETSVLNPRIVGKMLDLHPVLVFVVLIVAEHFFGMWGLLLGVPVAVYLGSLIVFDDRSPAAQGAMADSGLTGAGDDSRS